MYEIVDNELSILESIEIMYGEMIHLSYFIPFFFIDYLFLNGASSENI